jgi:hypothetical protein
MIGSFVAGFSRREVSMKIADCLVLPAQNVRSSLTTPGDIRSDIAFQNDINTLLARIEEAKLPWTAASLLVSFGAEGPVVAQPKRHSVTPPLRIFDGGASAARSGATESRPVEPVATVAPAAPRRARRRA